ncbi:hypothetical protein BOX15_Mlig007306g1, partial [Macrostomum lignano]
KYTVCQRESYIKKVFQATLSEMPKTTRDPDLSSEFSGLHEEQGHAPASLHSDDDAMHQSQLEHQQYSDSYSSMAVSFELGPGGTEYSWSESPGRASDDREAMPHQARGVHAAADLERVERFAGDAASATATAGQSLRRCHSTGISAHTAGNRAPESRGRAAAVAANVNRSASPRQLRFCGAEIFLAGMIRSVSSLSTFTVSQTTTLTIETDSNAVIS